MLRIVKGAFKRSLATAGYEIRRRLPDLDAATYTLCDLVEPYTMTSPERISALRDAVQYVLRNKVLGDIVECGVRKGGSMMVCALTILDELELRNLWLYDTFEGMSPPTGADVALISGKKADQLLNTRYRDARIWAVCALDDVKINVESTGYPKEQIRYVQGRVEDTIPVSAPECIALLRLDTDWYNSTYHELVHLSPRLSPGGVLIIDDYGVWGGSRKAVDQYFAEQRIKPLLHRIDHTGRMLVKYT
jgi:O-methyltransferase